MFDGSSSFSDQDLHAIADYLDEFAGDIREAEQHVDLSWRVGFPGNQADFEKLIAPLRAPEIRLRRRELDAALDAARQFLPDVAFVRLIAVLNDRRAQKLSQLD